MIQTPLRVMYTDGPQVLGGDRSGWMDTIRAAGVLSHMPSARSLGGCPSDITLFDDGIFLPYVSPVFREFMYQDPIPWKTDTGDGDVSWYTRLFRDLSSAERTAGKTDYRCLVLAPSLDDEEYDDFSSVKVWLTQPANATVTVGEDNNSITKAVTVASETAAPAGVVFSSPTAGAKLDLGPLTNASGNYIFLWIKRVHSAGAASAAYDKFTVHLSAETSGGDIWYTDIVVYYVLRTDSIDEIDIVGVRDGEVIDLSGDTYTITVKNSSGTAVDPPGQKMWVLCSSTLNHMTMAPHEEGGMWPGRTAMTTEELVRTATGVFTYQFRPATAGHYHLVLDAGGEFQAQHHIEVSPIAI
jgi:hypothetical protein